MTLISVRTCLVRASLEKYKGLIKLFTAWDTILLLSLPYIEKTFAVFFLYELYRLFYVYFLHLAKRKRLNVLSEQTEVGRKPGASRPSLNPLSLVKGEARALLGCRGSEWVNSS